MFFDTFYANSRFSKKGLDKPFGAVEKAVETVENSKNIVFARGARRNCLLKTFWDFLSSTFYKIIHFQRYAQREF